MVQLGVHLSIAPQFKAAAERAGEIGCTALQIFCCNPRGWKKKPLADSEVACFKSAVREAGIRSVVVHASYLINLAAPDGHYRKSVSAFIEELRRARKLGAAEFVIHPGSHKGAGADSGVKRVARALNRACRAVPGPIRILLENTAGGKNVLGNSVKQIGDILEQVNDGGRVGLCLDSCHALAAGYEVRTPQGIRGLLQEIRRHIGKERLGALHVNDSKFDLGSGRDRHEHLGEGFLGDAGLRVFLRQKSFRGLPAILETPQDSPDADRNNLDRAKRLAGRPVG